MAQLINVRKAIFLDNAERQYEELGYPHRNIEQYQCDNCKMIYSVDSSVKANYCYHCGAKQ